MLVFLLEQAEWLKTLVLKVLDEPTNPANTRVPLMFDISVLLFEGNSDGRKASITFAKTGWQVFTGATILKQQHMAEKIPESCIGDAGIPGYGYCQTPDAFLAYIL